MTQTIAAATKATLSNSFEQDLTRADAHCIHCGATCGAHPVHHDAKIFCCSGCVSVYQLLQQSSLGEQYYKSDNPPGLRPTVRQQTEFVYLDDPETVAKVSRVLSATRRLVKLSVPQIHCSSCVWLLEHLSSLQKGILVSRVNRGTQELSLQFDSNTISLRGVVELLARLGYEPKLTYESLSNSGAASHPHRRLTRQLAFAGFAFANIMLFSLPDYLSGGEIGTPELTLTFRIASLLLSLPVLLYSAQDYFVKSWLVLRAKAISIDFPIAIGIGMLFVRSAFDVFTGIGPGYFDSFTGLVFFLLLGRVVQQFTFQKLSFDRDFRSFLPIAVLRRDSRTHMLSSVSLDQLKRGDRIVIRNGEIVPADGMVNSMSGSVDYAFVTGESTPSSVSRGEQVLAGGRVAGESIEILLTTEVPSSVLTSLWSELPMESDRPKSKSLADVVALPFTLVVLALAVGTVLFWNAHQPDRLWHAATSVLIVACPCALVIAGPFALATVSRVWGKRGLFLRSPDVVERLARIDRVVLDKTGTLTNPDDLQLIPDENICSKTGLLIASLAQHSTHPVSRALVAQYQQSPLLQVTGFHEYVGKGIEGFIDGQQVRIGRINFVMNAAEGVAESNKTDLSVVAVSIDNRIVAQLRKIRALRHGIATSIEELRENYAPTILTGDAYTLNESSQEAIPDTVSTQVNCSPQEKRDFVQRLESNGVRTLMIGDGLNDAGALRVASVGIAVTDNSAAFTPASDAIMNGNEVSHLPRYLAEAGRVQRSLYVSYGFAVLYNGIGLWYAMSGELSPLVSAILMPLSSISVAVIAVLMSRAAVRLSKEKI